MQAKHAWQAALIVRAGLPRVAARRAGVGFPEEHLRTKVRAESTANVNRWVASDEGGRSAHSELLGSRIFSSLSSAERWSSVLKTMVFALQGPQGLFARGPGSGSKKYRVLLTGRRALAAGFSALIKHAVCSAGLWKLWYGRVSRECLATFSEFLQELEKCSDRQHRGMSRREHAHDNFCGSTWHAYAGADLCRGG
jgi:hypothetical protein